MMSVLHTLFGLTAPVDRRVYLTSGLSLMALKYGVDAAMVWFLEGGQLLHPVTYLNPRTGC